jgi:glycosyltransferase involved in cell wall biosynthesis
VCFAETRSVPNQIVLSGLLMRVLIVHNLYTRPGGEDVVVEQESELLRQHGHEVEILYVKNEAIEHASPLRQGKLVLDTIWSTEGARTLTTALGRYAPNIIHVHNTFTRLSPSIYWAADRLGIPVVQTLHNYRLTCANALLLRDHHACEACVGKFPLAALQYRCYRDSLPATSA